MRLTVGVKSGDISSLLCTGSEETIGLHHVAVHSEEDKISTVHVLIIALFQGSAKSGPLAKSGPRAPSIRPAEASSVLTFNPGYVLPPNAPKDNRLFTRRARFSLTLYSQSTMIDFSYACCHVDADWLPYTLAVRSLVQ